MYYILKIKTVVTSVTKSLPTLLLIKTNAGFGTAVI